MFVVDSISPAPEGGSEDGTFLIDAVSLTEWDENDVVIQNPSFEASGFALPWPGYHGTTTLSAGIAGWTSGAVGEAVERWHEPDTLRWPAQRAVFRQRHHARR